MIDCYIIAWNEEETIHLTIQHYQKFCNRIVLYDNHSTDDTCFIAKKLGCSVKKFGKPGELSDSAYKEVKNNCWKDSRFQWVIIVDADEILWHHNLKNVIDNTKGNIFKTFGWNVFSRDMPVNEWTEITYGHHEPNYSKLVIFKPKEITDINYHIGAHWATPKGQVKYADELLTVFHYRNAGGPERLIKRHEQYRPRMSKENLQRNWGHHYLEDDEIRVKEWNDKFEKSKTYLGAGII